METRIALIGIIVEDGQAAEKINRILHDYSRCIIGRMGLPYREREISIISIVMDAPNETISALSGKLGMIPGVSTRLCTQNCQRMNLENRKRDSIRGRISANYEDMRLCCVLSAVLQRCAKCCASEQEVYDT